MVSSEYVDRLETGDLLWRRVTVTLIISVWPTRPFLIYLHLKIIIKANSLRFKANPFKYETFY